MSNLFSLSDAAYAATKKGIADGVSLSDYAASAASFMGCTAEQFTTAYESRATTERESTMLSDTRAAVDKFKVTKSLSALVKRVKALSVTLDKPVSLDWVEGEDGKVSCSLVVGRGKRTHNSTRPGKNSRISAYVACQRGIKAGDKFSVEKKGTGYLLLLDNGAQIHAKRGKLAPTILDVYQNSSNGHDLSNTAAILVKYGYKL